MRRLLGESTDVGGDAIEVLSSSHTPAQYAEYAALARVHGLNASRRSDFHGPAKSWLDLGDLSPLPAMVTPVCPTWYASRGESQLNAFPAPDGQPHQHVQAKLLPFPVRQVRDTGLSDSKLTRGLYLRPATFLNQAPQPHHQVGAKCEYLRLGRLEAQVDKHVATRF
jgi:hypothetical protein